jgi:hypothetical protein
MQLAAACSKNQVALARRCRAIANSITIADEGI